MANNKTHITKNLTEKSIIVSREFNAPLTTVWRAYTESELLELWWAPRPWRAETKTMNFTVGGYWLYAMVSPEGKKHWGKMSYTSIDLHKNFHIEDSFCDENGITNIELPISKGSTTFTETTIGTLVEFKLTYNTEKEIETLVEMGFEQGITMTFDQLEILFKENKM